MADIIQGYASRSTLGREEYLAAVLNPQFRAARAAHARALPEASGKQDFAEYLALAAIDYSMAEISEKLTAYRPGSDAMFNVIAAKRAPSIAVVPPAPAAIAPASKSSADIWSEVIAEQNKRIGQ